jgi:hypothetical protein
LGVDIVQMDQTTSGAGDACACAAHGHPPGNGVYRSLAFRALMADMRQHGKSLSPDFMLAHEEPHEELIPCVDAFHTREYRERWWYHGVPGGRSLPLFTYLYHEYAIAYGGEGPHATASKSPYTSDPPLFSVQAHPHPHVRSVFPARPENGHSILFLRPAVNAGPQKTPEPT